MRRGKSFLGGDPFVRGRNTPPFKINDRVVTRAEYRRQWGIAFGDPRKAARPLPRGARARDRKRAIDLRATRIGCEHDFEYHEDVIGDYVYTATERWLECPHCGEQRSASWEDAPVYEDY